MNLKETIFGGKVKPTEDKAFVYAGSLQKWLPVLNVVKGVIVTKDYRFVKVIELRPVNFYLKSKNDQQNIIYYFASYLKIAPNNIQIRVMTQKADIEGYIGMMRGCLNLEENERCREMIEDNIREVAYIAENEAISHRFFLIIQYEPHMKARSNTVEAIAERLNEEADTARRYLDMCGLETVEPEYYDNHILELLYEIINKRTSRRVKLPQGVYDMLGAVHGVYENTEFEESNAYASSSSNDRDQKHEDSKTEKKRRALFRRKEKQLDVSIIEAGSTTILDILSPTSANLKPPDYIEIDGVFHAYLYITGYGYATTVGSGWLSALVEAGEGVSFSFFLKRQPKEKILSSISQTTMINRSRMRDVGDARQDFEEIDSAINAGLYLKNSMNRNNEDFYYMHTLIEITASDLETLQQRLSAAENRCLSIEMLARRCDMKHDRAFLSSLPILYLDPDIERKSKRNALTSGVSAAFPFASYELYDNGGIFLGINQHNRSNCIVNLFDDSKYSNGNLCLLGQSGSGKTFTLQLMASRLRQQGKRIFIIAPRKGSEYRANCSLIGGNFVKIAPSSNDCINVMDIRRTTLDGAAKLKEQKERDDSLLAEKISRLHIFYSLLKKQMSEEDRTYIDTALVECYGRIGITFDNDSIFEADGKTPKKMPVIADWHGILNEKEETRHLASVLSRFVTGSASRMGQRTNIDMQSMYYVFDISEAPKDLLPAIMFETADYILDYLKEFQIDGSGRLMLSVVILDELWHLIGASSNPEAAEFVLELVKTVRGLGGVCVSASQDLIDFFALEGGKYGKAVLNNSRLKILLQMEEDEARLVQQFMNLSDDELSQITRSSRGEGLLCAGSNRINIAMHASAKEYDAITTSPSDISEKLKNKTRQGSDQND